MNDYFIKLFLLPIICIWLLTSSNNVQSSDFKELSIRGVLPSFIRQASKGDTLRVAYLGGSITEQKGWRIYSLEWLKEQFPKSTFLEINAAIGGTGSDFGVFRLEKHVLQFKPDLLFLEFAVNDDGKNPADIERSVESIIRQSKNFNPEMDICLIYTIKHDFMESLERGDMPQSIKSMEKIADYYGIPSINFGIEVAGRVKEGNLIMIDKEIKKDGKKVFSPDGVDPYTETGHRIYQQVFARCFEQIMHDYQPPNHNKRLPAPVRSDLYDNARSVNFDELPSQHGWQKTVLSKELKFNRVNKLIKSAMYSMIPDASVNFSFTGTTVGACDLMGPGAGRVIVKIDGKLIDTINRFDKYSTYWRANYFLIDNLKDTLHLVSFIQFKEPFDKTAILRPDQKITDEAEYHVFNWYPCEILLNGNMNLIKND